MAATKTNSRFMPNSRKGKTKYTLVERDAYLPTAVDAAALAVLLSRPDVLGEVTSQRPITVKEAERGRIRIDTAEELTDRVRDLDAHEALMVRYGGGKTFEATVAWFNRSLGRGCVVEADGTWHILYACNIEGKKTWFSETACIYVNEGDVLTCKLEHLTSREPICVSLTRGTVDEEKWASLDQSRLAFRCNDKGKAVSGLFG